MSRLQAHLLPDGRRLHLQDGPIDLVIGADGAASAVAAAYRAAAAEMDGLLDRLCAELPMLRARAMPLQNAPPSPLAGEGAWTKAGRMRGLGAALDHEPSSAESAGVTPSSVAAPRRYLLPPGEKGLRPESADPVARRMAAAVAPFADEIFITPMAAVAGAVADAVLNAMLRAARLDRAFVNDGGDIALHCAPGRRFTVGLIDRPDRPSLFGRVEVGDRDGVGGIATSGWRGRSFSRGIADSVTILGRTAAEADAAATVVANAVDLPGHPAVRRAPADSVHPDSDLGARLVTRDVGPLAASEIAEALARGLSRAEELIDRGLILGAALQLQGSVRIVDHPDRTVLPPLTRHPEVARHV